MLAWAYLMNLAAQRLGWTPDVFWAATPWELRTALGGPGDAAPLSRQGLDALLRLYPDARPL